LPALGIQVEQGDQPAIARQNRCACDRRQLLERTVGSDAGEQFAGLRGIALDQEQRLEDKANI